jgi:hypothetical protein
VWRNTESVYRPWTNGERVCGETQQRSESRVSAMQCSSAPIQTWLSCAAQQRHVTSLRHITSPQHDPHVISRPSVHVLHVTSRLSRHIKSSRPSHITYRALRHVPPPRKITSPVTSRPPRLYFPFLASL